jgi:hypothetical protein
MALIPMDELQTLKAASAVKTTANTAEVDQQTQAIAYLINTAANCGQYKVAYTGTILDSVKTTLEGQGYTISYELGTAIENNVAYISWE